MKPKLLDLFCGAGGAAMGYHRAGFEVVGVDINPQPHYPFEFHQADALAFPLEGYDAYHASPPCQAYSMMQHIHKNKATHPDLVEPTRILLTSTKKPFVVENVDGSPLVGFVTLLCGTMFGLPIKKHRFFETSFELPLFAPTVCNHKDTLDLYHGGEAARNEKEKLIEAMGIDWMTNTRNELRQAIPPAYTEYIGKYLLEAIKL